MKNDTWKHKNLSTWYISLSATRNLLSYRGRMTWPIWKGRKGLNLTQSGWACPYFRRGGTFLKRITDTVTSLQKPNHKSKCQRRQHISHRGGTEGRVPKQIWLGRKPKGRYRSRNSEWSYLGSQLRWSDSIFSLCYSQKPWGIQKLYAALWLPQTKLQGWCLAHIVSHIWTETPCPNQCLATLRSPAGRPSSPGLRLGLHLVHLP